MRRRGCSSVSPSGSWGGKMRGRKEDGGRGEVLEGQRVVLERGEPVRHRGMPGVPGLREKAQVRKPQGLHDLPLLSEGFPVGLLPPGGVSEKEKEGTHAEGDEQNKGRGLPAQRH